MELSAECKEHVRACLNARTGHLDYTTGEWVVGRDAPWVPGSAFIRFPELKDFLLAAIEGQVQTDG